MVGGNAGACGAALARGRRQHPRHSRLMLTGLPPQLTKCARARSNQFTAAMTRRSRLVECCARARVVPEAEGVELAQDAGSVAESMDSEDAEAADHARGAEALAAPGAAAAAVEDAYLDGTVCRDTCVGEQQS